MDHSDCIRVIFQNMDVTIHAFTVCDESGFYTICLNPRLSYEMQAEAYDHELSHIRNGDFDRMQDVNRDLYEEDVSVLEAKRHKDK